MVIQRQSRQGERNVFQRTQGAGIIMDLSEIASLYLREKMQFLLNEGEEVSYLRTGTVVQMLEREGHGLAYQTDFYPLDTKLTEAEFAALVSLKATEDATAKEIPVILLKLLECHFQTLTERREQLRKAHPGEEVILFFSPADTIAHANTVAMEVYAFINDRDIEGIWLETESSFLIVPKNVPSSVYTLD